jgi:hypothetical protein
MNYRNRSLTHPGDRIMALAGVARAFQFERSWTYLAGAWRECLPYQLLWYAKSFGDRRTTTDTAIEHGSRTAPSWSWFKQPRYSSDDLDYECHPLGHLAFEYEEPLLVELDYFQWPGQPKNHCPDTAFYDFTGLRIALVLPTFTTSLRSPHGSDVSEIPVCASLAKSMEANHRHRYNRISYYCDDPSELETHPENILLAVIVESQELPERDNFVYNIAGLGLQAGEEDGTWKRHGFWRASVRIERAIKPTDMLPAGEFWFLSLEGAKIETLILV